VGGRAGGGREGRTGPGRAQANIRTEESGAGQSNLGWSLFRIANPIGELALNRTLSTPTSLEQAQPSKRAHAGKRATDPSPLQLTLDLHLWANWRINGMCRTNQNQRIHSHYQPG